MNRKNQSLRIRLKTVRISMSALIITLLVFILSILVWSNTAYNHILSGYQDVQQYYTSLSECTDTVKDSLVNGIGENDDDYMASLQEAKDCVTRLKANPYLQEKWRLDQLDNLLDSYNEAVDALETSYQEDPAVGAYQISYEDFLEKDALIQGTSVFYYDLLTASMNRVQEGFRFISLGFLGAGILICILTLIWMQSLRRFFNDDLAKPLSEISDNISSIQNGQYSLSSENASSREMAEIYQALEEMASKVRHAINLEKENAALEKKLAQSELRMLQNQINPHFLFNTLNMIYILCEEGENEAAGEMIFRTSHLLRYCLDKQSRVSSLEKEAAALQDYMEIQSKRMSGKIEFDLITGADPSWRSVPVPAMILQPLVENSILHGLKNCMEGGKITVFIEKEDKQTRITIEDNGTGFDPKEIEPALSGQQMPEADENRKGTGLGLFNVLHRMEMFYPEKFEYEIDSAPGRGCRIVLILNEEEKHG